MTAVAMKVLKETLLAFWHGKEVCKGSKRVRLAALCEDSQKPLQVHATEIERLLLPDYGDFREKHLRKIALDTFHSTKNDAYL